MDKRLEDLVEIANPQQPHCAVVLLLDVSGSMQGEKIDALNEGIKLFKEEVERDDLASKRVDLAIIKFGESTQVIQDFTTINEFQVPTLAARGLTPMGEAILKGIEIVEERKKQYRQNGIDYYRPWIFLITDGEPTDMQPGDYKWNEVLNKVHEGELKKKFMFFAVAVDPANLDTLSQVAPPNRKPVRLKGLTFRELFSWLSRSLSAVSSSNPGEQIALESPAAAGWAEIDV